DVCSSDLNGARLGGERDAVADQLQHFSRVRLVQWQAAGGEHGNLCRVAVEAGNLMSDVGQREASGQAHVASADNGDSHRCLSSFSRDGRTAFETTRLDSRRSPTGAVPAGTGAGCMATAARTSRGSPRTAGGRGRR